MVARIRRVLCGKLNGWKTTEDDDDKTPGIRSRTSCQPLFCCSHATARYIRTTAVAEWKKYTCMQPRPCSQTFMWSSNAVIYAYARIPRDKWKLENLLAKLSRLSLAADAKKALIAHEYMRGLPRTLKFKLLEHNPTPTLDKIAFIHPTIRCRSARATRYQTPTGRSEFSDFYPTATRPAGNITPEPFCAFLRVYYWCEKKACLQGYM